MSGTSASLPMATVDTVILSLAIRRNSPAKSPRVIWPSERKITCFKQRRPIEEHLVGLLERRVAVGAAAGLDGGDGAMDRLLVAGGPER